MNKEKVMEIGRLSHRKDVGYVFKQGRGVAAELVSQHPEIGDLYTRDKLSQHAIARTVLPELMQIYPNVAVMAVRFALESLVPPDTRQAIASQRNRDKLQAVRDTLGPNGVKEHQRQAALAKQQKHPASPEQIVELLRKKGQTLWSKDEVQFAEFLYAKYRGRKNALVYAEIAAEVNTVFHEGRNVRNGEGVTRKLFDQRQLAHKKNNL